MKDCVFLLFLWIVTVSRGDTEVSCVFMERCILPCSFQAGPHVVIHWAHMKRLLVHSHYDKQDQLRRQDQIYRNRTSLFKDQISRGNASLQLTGVKVQDEGTYKCFTNGKNGEEDSYINLKVEAPVHEVNIQQVENRMSCSSEGIYPQPELTWSTTPPSNINLHNTTTVQQNEEQLYSISSSLILSHSHTDLVYSCTVTTPTNNMTASLSRTGNSVNGGRNRVGLVGAVLVAAAAAVVVVVVGVGVGLFLFWKKKKGQKENSKRRSSCDKTTYSQ